MDFSKWRTAWQMIFKEQESQQRECRSVKTWFSIALKGPFLQALLCIKSHSRQPWSLIHCELSMVPHLLLGDFFPLPRSHGLLCPSYISLIFVEALFLRIKRKGIYSQVEFHCRHNETRSRSLGVKNGSVGTGVLIASEDVVGNERAKRP